MKVISFFIILLFPSILGAQWKRSGNEPVGPADQQLKTGNHTIMINSMDLRNETQKWTSLDSSLNMIAVKKLITPYGKRIVRQTYLESVNAVIRVDQYLLDEQLHISAYVFDVLGNILYRKDIQDTAVAGGRILPSPYTISQSPDKKVVSLVQSMVIGDERISISSINFSTELKVISNNTYTFSFDPKQSDMYMPMVDNMGCVLIFIADKFDSYKLGSILTCYLLQGEDEATKRVQFDFERKKIKGLNFNLSGDTLFFSALFSGTPGRKDIAGVLNAGLEISTQKKIPVTEKFYNNDAKKRLGKL